MNRRKERDASDMQIGLKIQKLRKKYGLTQQELADRAELSKGFISQLERDQTSPSIATLMDILECLGTNLQDFFKEPKEEKVVFRPEDIFEKEDEENGNRIAWLIPHAQKNRMEPILLTLHPGGKTEIDDPHEGEEFGHVLSGSVVLTIGETRRKLKKGDSFCFLATEPHQIATLSKHEAKVLWVSTPPSF